MATIQHHRYRNYQQQQQQYEDDWENDFISSHNNNSIFSTSTTRKASVFTMDHEKELTLACERYQYPARHYYLEDDDTASSVTSGSILSEIAGACSSIFSELDSALNDIDEFMYDEPPPATFHSPPITRPIVASSSSPQQQQPQKFDLTQFPGVVKRLGSVSSSYSRYGGLVTQDNDDWADDVDMPKDGFSALNPVKKIYGELLLDDDEEEEDDFIKEATQAEQAMNRPNLLIQPAQQLQKISLPTTTNQPPAAPTASFSRPIYDYQVEREQDDDGDMTGLDFPENMAILPIRLDEKKQYNLTTLHQQQPSASRSTRIPISTNKLAKSSNKYLSMTQREKDDDDFMDGLVIQDAKFTTSISVPTLSSSRVPQQQGMSNKTRETTKNLVSRLARPSPLYQNGNKPSDHATTLAKKSSSSNLRQQRLQQQQQGTTVTKQHQTFLASTKSARQREADIATKLGNIRRLYKSSSNNTLPESPRSLLTNKSLLQQRNIDQQPVVEKKSANGYTLIAQPKSKVTTYISRLDHLDSLNDLRPFSSSRAAAKRPLNTSSSQPQKMQLHKKLEIVERDRPWRKNMQTTSSASNSKIKLIKPNEQNLNKEYNDMKYDESTHCWKGNETSLIGFQQQEKSRRRPMLITNKHQKSSTPSRYAAVVGSTMIFNTDLQSWVSANGSGAECNELDTIEDLKDELLKAPAGNNSSNNFYHNGCNTTENRAAAVSDNKLLDFKLSIEVKRQMMFEQEQHETWIANWFPSCRQHDESHY